MLYIERSARGEKRRESVAALLRCVDTSWECSERRGNIVFVEFRRRRERVLISACRDSCAIPTRNAQVYSHCHRSMLGPTLCGHSLKSTEAFLELRFYSSTDWLKWQGCSIRTGKHTILVHLFETVSVQSGLLHSHWPVSFQTFCKTLGFFSSILFCIFFVGKLASPPCGVFPVVKTRSEQEIEMSVTDSHIRIWCRKVRVSRDGFEMPSRCVTLRDQKCTLSCIAGDTMQ